MLQPYFHSHSTRRRLVRRAFGVALVSTALVRAAEATPAPGAQRSGPTGQVEIKNVAFDSVRIEVRVGRHAHCDANPVAAVLMLKRDRTWTITSDQTVCWRRELAPGAGDYQWTPWQRHVLAPGQIVRRNP